MVSMDLIYTVFNKEDAISRRSVVRNSGSEGINANGIFIEKLMSVTVDFHIRSSAFWVTQLSGEYIYYFEPCSVDICMVGPRSC
mmetsp:Transcript_19366/g.23560  ORF Transcript_19366/g.23560 Transcript_19366/m.23560 type:complete len:84 (+) Transcript_19366:213-464(+)